MTATPDPSATVSTADALPTIRSGIPGWWVVLGMLAFGVGTTGSVAVYWNEHTRPFRPLTIALGKEFPKSIPKVEGGRHKGGPATLRLALRTQFEPQTDDVATQKMVNRIVQLSRETLAAPHPFDSFEMLQIYLLQLAPQKTAEHQLFEFKVDELKGDVPFPDAGIP
jgi:hypothetical protein